MYDHSGISVSMSPFSCSWDSGRVGNAIMRRRRGLTSAKAKKRLEGLVNYLNMLVTGEVYEYVITDENGKEVDSCYGFVGPEEECLKEGKNAAGRMK
jgi:hypothetical protein